MKRRRIQLSTRHKRWFFAVSVTLFLAGVPALRGSHIWQGRRDLGP